jgi:hypothetical protein
MRFEWECARGVIGTDDEQWVSNLMDGVILIWGLAGVRGFVGN